MNNQEQTKKCDSITHTSLRCKNTAKYGSKCGVHFTHTCKCYYTDGEYNERCNAECDKGELYCSDHMDDLEDGGFFEWNADNFKECETSTAFYEALTPFIWVVVEVGNNKTCYKMDYPIKKRHRDVKYTFDEKIKRVDEDIEFIKVLFDDYIRFVNILYKTEYIKEGDNLRAMREDILRQLTFERGIKHVEFNALGMDGVNECIKTCIYQPRGINNLIEYFIEKRYNREEHLYNISLFVEGQEDKLTEWCDELNGANIFVLVSHTNAKPYRPSIKSFVVGDRVLYKGNYTAPKYGVIDMINKDYMGISGRRHIINKHNKKQHKIDWDKKEGGCGFNYGQMLKIVECARWAGDDDKFIKSNEWVNIED